MRLPCDLCVIDSDATPCSVTNAIVLHILTSVNSTGSCGTSFTNTNNANTNFIATVYYGYEYSSITWSRCSLLGQ